MRLLISKCIFHSLKGCSVSSSSSSLHTVCSYLRPPGLGPGRIGLVGQVPWPVHERVALLAAALGQAELWLGR